tara:strand:- start:366 stop:974 length:609 start_codon:yes stop_codon:yes gene_type:complete
MLYAILIFDEPDSAALRDQYRQCHLDYLQDFDEQTMFAGPFTTDDESADLGSLRLIEFPSREAATKHVEDEPYVIGGVQKRWHIHRWEASIPYTWRDCPRTEGNIQVLFHALDKPDAGALRKENTPANLAYLEENRNSVMSRGPLLADDGETQIGSVFLLDVGDIDAAHRLKDNMPFYQVGLFQDITFHRWRFGRVFDRFKG